MDKSTIALILSKFESIEKRLESIEKEQRKINSTMSSLKVTVATMGSLFGYIGAYIKSKMHF